MVNFLSFHPFIWLFRVCTSLKSPLLLNSFSKNLIPKFLPFVRNAMVISIRLMKGTRATNYLHVKKAKRAEQTRKSM